MVHRQTRFQIGTRSLARVMTVWLVLGCTKDATLTQQQTLGAPEQEGPEPARRTTGAVSSEEGSKASHASELENDAGSGMKAAPDGSLECWQLPIVDRARLYPAPGAAALLEGGKIQGSNTSATNGFVDLGVVTQPAQDGEWYELRFENSTAYRFVKYYGPTGSHGALAELELYAGERRVDGAGFGSAGSRDELGTIYEHALDGDIGTWFEGPAPSDNYVGVDAGAGHVAAAPQMTPEPGPLQAGAAVTLSAEPGARISYTLDGSDPRSAGEPYLAPIVLSEGTTLISALAERDCSLQSEITRGIYQIGDAGAGVAPGARRSVQSSMHIGNSLTDTIVEYLTTVAQDGGIALDFNRYTLPGAGTWLYEQNPTGGFGVADVQQTLRTRPFDHLTMQPYPNLPCQPAPSADGNDSDSGYVAQAWADARTQNPNVQLWIYQQWPAPNDYVTCFSGGGWTRGDWQPSAPGSWEEAVATELTYQEAVRAELVRMQPDAPPPYIIPGGLALVELKRAMDAGQVPGMDNFFNTMFLAGGDDIHLTPAGAYYITLVFYASMFQTSPEGLGNHSGGSLTDAQAGVLQTLVWQVVSNYPLSGVTRPSL